MNLNITDHDSRMCVYDHTGNVSISRDWSVRHLHTMFIQLMFPDADSGWSSIVTVSPEFKYRPWIKLPISYREIGDFYDISTT